MKIGIICAVEKELAPFLPHIQAKIVTQKAMLTFHCGMIGDAEVVAVFSGVCKVNAAIATQVLLDTFHVDAVINAGTAGGMDPKLQVLDTVIAEEVGYHDVASGVLTEYHPWMPTPFFRSDTWLLAIAKRATENQERVFFGRTVTGEVFIADDGRQEILDKFSPLTVDMETASMAHVCYVNQVPFLSVRCITDTAEHSGEENFAKNCIRAAEHAKNTVLAILDELNKSTERICAYGTQA